MKHSGLMARFEVLNKRILPRKIGLNFVIQMVNLKCRTRFVDSNMSVRYSWLAVKLLWNFSCNKESSLTERIEGSEAVWVICKWILTGVTSAIAMNHMVNTVDIDTVSVNCIRELILWCTGYSIGLKNLSLQVQFQQLAWRFLQFNLNLFVMNIRVLKTGLKAYQC